MTARTLLTTLALAVLVLPPSAAADSGWRWPVEGELLTAYRNSADPYAGGQHRGIDIAAPAGARVVAATSGTVLFAGVAGDSGRTVSIRTADGRFSTSYLHLESIAVGRGDRVSAGHALGTVGTTGRRSLARPHLHFGVREAGERFAYRDPLSLLPPPGVPGGQPAEPKPVAAPLPLPAEPAAVSVTPPLFAGPSPAALSLPAEPHPVAPSVSTATAPALAPAEAFSAPVSSRAPTPSLRPIAATGGGASLSRSRRDAAPATGAPSHARPRAHGSSERRTAPSARPTEIQAGTTRERAAVSSDAARHGDLAAHPARGPVRSADPREGERGPSRRSSPSAGSGIGDRGGLDLGWLAACAAMVAVATLLARPAGPGTPSRGARSPDRRRAGSQPKSFAAAMSPESTSRG